MPVFQANKSILIKCVTSLPAIATTLMKAMFNKQNTKEYQLSVDVKNTNLIILILKFISKVFFKRNEL